jgi:hypothetical protein
MRKIFILILLFFTLTLSSCNTNINSSIYISSIGFEIKDDKLVTYFLSNPLTDISRSSEDKEKEAQFVRVEASSVYEAFNEAKQSLLSPLNFLHVKTVIFTEECFSSKYILDFLTFIKSVRFISYNFYVFATISKIEDLYKFKNPEQISYQYSILSSPDLLPYSDFGIEKLHFLDFANDYYNSGRYLHIPLILINDAWGKNITIEVDGFLCYGFPITLYRNSEFKGMLYLYDKNSLLFHDDDDVYRITNYRVNKYVRNNRFVFSISYEDITVFGDGSRSKFEEKLVMEIKKYLDSYTTNQNGLYLIKFYNYLNTKSLNLYDFDIEILHKG